MTKKSDEEKMATFMETVSVLFLVVVMVFIFLKFLFF